MSERTDLFIAEAMNGLFDEIDRTIVLVRILSEENEGQWGFSPPGAYHRDEFRVFHVDADDTAYVIRTLRQAHAAATRRGVEHLLASMATDGSWTSPACVWEFHSDERDVWRAYDTHRAYVSARCTIALRRAATP